MYKRKLFGVIPMKWLSGLEHKSPKGRFTNGYAWSDGIANMLANKFIINDEEKARKLEDTDIADQVITHSPEIEKLEKKYSLADDTTVKYGGHVYVRNYDEGGLTAHDYKWWPSTSITRYFSRLILSTLSHKRDDLFAYDEKHHVSKNYKEGTLVVEWSGANDLITVNAEPSIAEADRAVKDRISNVKKLIEHGYQHFVLFNLPNLALTPRYQKKDKPAQDKANEVTQHFNKTLLAECAKLQQRYPYFTIDVFDINKEFEEIYKNPEEYNLKEELLTKPYTESAGFEKIADQPEKIKKAASSLSHAKGYMFWDDVHPTAYVHRRIADTFYQKYIKEYNFSTEQIDVEQTDELNFTAVEMTNLFKNEYDRQLNKDYSSMFGFLTSTKLRVNYKNPEQALQQILMHALYEKGNRTRAIITKLKWIDKDGNLNLNIPVIREAMEKVEFDQSNLNSHRK